MSDLIKDSFYISKVEKANLVKEAEKTGIKTSEMLRRILDKYFEDSSIGDINEKSKINNTRGKKKKF